MCAPVLSGLDAAIQLPGHPMGCLAQIPAAPPRPLPPLFLHSIRPALECAFGTEDEAHFPEALAGLVARLRATSSGPAPEEAYASGAEAHASAAEA